jgi:hypothetical protein
MLWLTAMEKKSKTRHQPNAFLAFGFLILPITLVYLTMLIITVANNSGTGSIDPSWVLGLGLAPLKDTWPWSLTGIICIILISFVLSHRRRFWFLLTLTTAYSLIMLYMFLSAATYVPSIYY